MLTDNQEAILRWLVKTGETTPAECMQAMRLNETFCYRQLRIMRHDGWVEQEHGKLCITDMGREELRIQSGSRGSLRHDAPRPQGKRSGVIAGPAYATGFRWRGVRWQ